MPQRSFTPCATVETATACIGHHRRFAAAMDDKDDYSQVICKRGTDEIPLPRYPPAPSSPHRQSSSPSPAACS